jgi:hypothetical protein
MGVGAVRDSRVRVRDYGVRVREGQNLAWQVAANISGYVNVSNHHTSAPNETALAEAVATVGPVSVCLNSGPMQTCVRTHAHARPPARPPRALHDGCSYGSGILEKCADVTDHCAPRCSARAFLFALERKLTSEHPTHPSTRARAPSHPRTRTHSSRRRCGNRDRAARMR